MRFFVPARDFLSVLMTRDEIFQKVGSQAASSMTSSLSDFLLLPFVCFFLSACCCSGKTHHHVTKLFVIITFKQHAPKEDKEDSLACRRRLWCFFLSCLFLLLRSDTKILIY
jgi:hypothetical protein